MGNGLIATTAASCPELNDISIPELAARARYLLRDSRFLLSAENVWPHYKLIVHDLLCDDVIDNIGRFLKDQFMVGLVLFPLCVVLTHDFVTRRAAWMTHLEESGAEDSSGAEYSDASELMDISKTQRETYSEMQQIDESARQVKIRSL